MDSRRIFDGTLNLWNNCYITVTTNFDGRRRHQLLPCGVDITKCLLTQPIIRTLHKTKLSYLSWGKTVRHLVKPIQRTLNIIMQFVNEWLSNLVALPNLYFHCSLWPVPSNVSRVWGIDHVESSTVSLSNHRPCEKRFRVSWMFTLNPKKNNKRKEKINGKVRLGNWPFLSSSQSLFRSESKCEIFVMIIRSNFNENENWFSWQRLST